MNTLQTNKRLELLDIIEKLQSLTEQGAIEWKEEAINYTYADYQYHATVGNEAFSVGGEYLTIYEVQDSGSKLVAKITQRMMPTNCDEEYEKLILLAQMSSNTQNKYTSFIPVFNHLDKHEKDFLATKAPEQVED